MKWIKGVCPKKQVLQKADDFIVEIQFQAAKHLLVSKPNAEFYLKQKIDFIKRELKTCPAEYRNKIIELIKGLEV